MLSPDFTQNYFELFGISPGYHIDVAGLHAEQQRLLANYHPDRHVNVSDQEKRLSVQAASWINQAYDTLRDSVKRSRYLLEVAGADIPEDHATTSDTSFLMEQIELRESVDACREAEDGLLLSEKIAQQLQHRGQELSDDFVRSFESGDLASAVSSYQKMQFIQRIQLQLSELQFELEDD